MLRAGNAESFTVERDGGTRRLDVTIGRRTVEDMFGRDVALGFLGITSSSDPADEITVRYGPIAAVGRGAERTWRVVETTGRYMGRMVTGRESADQLGGPLRIAAMSGRTAERSFASAGPDDDLGGRITRTMVALFTLAALLSIGIGLVNLLPIPVLDGGHLVYYAYEAAAGRPLGEGAQEWGFRIGLAFVLGLMLFVTWNDIRYLRVFEALGNLLS